jgi:hypothetical protein
MYIYKEVLLILLRIQSAGTFLDSMGVDELNKQVLKYLTLSPFPPLNSDGAIPQDELNKQVLKYLETFSCPACRAQQAGTNITRARLAVLHRLGIKLDMLVPACRARLVEQLLSSSTSRY